MENKVPEREEEEQVQNTSSAVESETSGTSPEPTQASEQPTPAVQAEIDSSPSLNTLKESEPSSPPANSESSQQSGSHPSSQSPPVSETATASDVIPTREERTMAMWCHLLALSGFVIPFGSIIGPLVLWLIKRKESPYIDAQGKEAVNFQISIFIYMIASAILILVAVGFLPMFAVGIFALVYTIIAAEKANNGEDFRYPVTIRFIK